MDEKEHHATLDEILSEVEADPALSGDTAGADSAATESQRAQAPAAGAFAGLGEGVPGLGSLLGNPELLNKLPVLLQVFKSFSEMKTDGKENAGGKGGHPDSPIGLLLALRPYLGENRRRAVDAMVRVTKLSDSLRSLR